MFILTIVLIGCTTEIPPVDEEVEIPTEEPAETPPEETDQEPAEVEEEPEDKVVDSIPNELTVIAENLNAPWSIEKIGDTFYITERPGAIVKVVDGEETRQEVALAHELATAEEAGLMGFVLAPDFAESNLAYAYYTYVDSGRQYNKIVMLRLEDNRWTEDRVLMDEIPSGPYHHGGRLKIGPDEKLYATVGDALNAEIAQNLNSLAGKILRLNLDGTIPADNPFENSAIYSYGHRNNQGLVWLPDGTLYASEHGNSANDEINAVTAGLNYGWPIIEGATEQEGMVAPDFTSGANTTWAPSGMATYDNKLYVAGLRGNAVFVFDLETAEVTEVLKEFGRIRDIYIEENHLYFITNNTDGRGNPEEADDKLYRIGLSELE